MSSINACRMRRYARQSGRGSDQVGVLSGVKDRVDHLLNLEMGAEAVGLFNQGREAFGLRQPKSLAFESHLQKAGMLKFAEHCVDLLAARCPQVSHGNLNFSKHPQLGGLCHA